MPVTSPIARSSALKSRLAVLLAGTAITLLPSGIWAQSATTEDCALVQGQLPPGCEIGNAGLAVEMPYSRNAETDGRAPSLSGDGFAITIGGQGQGTRAAAQPDRNADQALEDADIQVKYDGLYAERRLNVATEDLRSAFRPGETVSFRASSNYPGQIARAEVRITAQSEGFGLPRTTLVPIPANGTAGWAMPADDTDSYTYVLRVYDADGRFDETSPLPLDRQTNPAMPVLNDPIIAAGEGEDNTARRNIPAGGGVVTVFGEGLPPNATVTVMGQSVPVDADGRFVTQRLMPFGTHGVSVDLSAPGARGVVIEREVVIPRSDWFYAGIADFTLSKRGTTLGNGVVRKEGRLSFYAKGTIDGQTRITASADTGEGDMDRLFDDFFDKSPRSLLDRIDPDDLYPTYGDDSRIVDDAPTSGRIFLKAERGDSHVMWGDFRNEIDGTRFVNTARNLYGAQAVYRSPGSTADGERRTELSFYAASPDSLPQRDELRGTGGSAYFLKRQDIVPGTETIRVDTVDPVSGRVIATKQLVAGQDYRIDYIQGTVILTSPLSSSVGSGSVVSGGAGGAYDVNLVAQYEYETTGAPLDGASFGGRVETWLPGDRVRVGLTGMDETTDTADLRVLGADARVTFGRASYLEAEVARSEGIGFGRSISTDGGLTFTDLPSVASIGAASAYRIEGVLDLGDVVAGGDGTITAYAERKEAGFKTLSEDITADTRLWGLDAAVRLSPRTDLRLSFKDFDQTGGESRLEGTADVGYLLSSGLKAEIGIRYLDAVDPTDPTDTGTRSDLGFRLTRTFDDETALYGFAQGTLNRSGGLARNDRLGVGGKFRLSETVTAEGEISDGTSGLGARAILGYKPSYDARYYLGYELDPDREVAGQTLNGRDGGRLVLGAERQVGASTTIFAENNYDMFGRRRSLTSAYGVTYTPDSVWKLSGGIEIGTVRDAVSGDFDRTAASFGVTYDDGDGVTGKLRAEARVEDGANPAQDRRTWLLAGSYGYQVNPDWRAVATLDALISDSDQSAFLDGRYIETSLGFAYRPVANDRLNALAKYTWLYDLPGNNQVNAGGSASGNKQRSHILSLDAIYELSPTWEIGGKLAYRSSETAPRSGGPFTDNDAALAALRATWHLVHEWDIQGEVRTLVLPSADQQEWGVVASAYRHVGNNVKIGLGVNFGRFSDDLTDTTLDDRGLFLNVVGKF